jgi:hypothetical protein
VGAGRYSAGRIFLQVVPSFKNLQRDTKREVDKLNSQISKDLDKSAEATGRRAGEKAGSSYLMGFEKKAIADQKALNKALSKGMADFDKMRKADYERSKKAAQKVWDDRRAQARKERAKYDADERKAAKAKALREEKEAALAERREEQRLKKMSRLQAQANAEDIRRTKQKHTAAQKAQRDYERWWDAQMDKADAKEQARMKKRAAEHARAIAQNIAFDKKALATRAAMEAKQAAADEKALRQRMATRGGLARKEIEKAVSGIEKKLGDVDLATPIGRELDRVKRKAQGVSKDLSAGLINADTGRRQIEALGRDLERVMRRNKGTIGDSDRGNIRATVRDIRQMTQSMDGAASNGNAFSRMLRGATGDGQDGANAFRIFNYRVLAVASALPLLVPILATVGAGLVSLGTAALGAGAGLGVMILAFSGISDAVKAMGDVQDNAAKDALATGKAMRNAARGVRDAQQGLTQARLQAARAAEDSSRRIADAEDNLAEAQKNATKAQEDLRKARREAQADQDALADRIASGALDERQALIDLFNAQVAYNAAMADGGATNLEKEQASIDLERAQLAIKGIRKDNKAMAAEQADNAKKGVAGSEAVLSAQESQRDAAKAVADAEQGVADARRDAAQQAADSARSIRDAQERVADAQAAQTEAVTQTGDIGSASMHKLETAMGKLSPAGRDFARYLFSLRPEFEKLRGVAQEGMLPGVQTFMENMMKRYGPGFTRFVGTMAKGLGDFFVQMGTVFESPVWSDFFAMMEKNGPAFAKAFGEGFLNIATGFAGLMTAMEPFTAMMTEGFLNATASFADWGASLTKSEGFQKFLAYLEKTGPKVWTLLEEIVGAFVNLGVALAPIADKLLDFAITFFGWIADMDPDTLAAIATAIIGFVLASQIAAGAMQTLITLTTPFHSLFGLIVFAVVALGAALIYFYQHSDKFRDFVDKVLGFIKDNWKVVAWLAGAFVTLGGVLFGAWKILSIFVGKMAALRYIFALMTGWVGVIILAIIALGALFIWLWNNNETFKNAVITAWGYIKTAAVWLFENILMPYFKALIWYWGKIAEVLLWVWSNVLWPVFKAIGAIALWLWQKVLGPVLNLFWQGIKMWAEVVSWLWSVVGPVIELIGAIFSWLWEKAIGPALSWIGDKFKWLSDKITEIWTKYIDPILDKFGLGADDLKGYWDTAIAGIGKAWESLQDLVKKPMRWIVETVINKGFVDNFNKLADVFGTSHIPHMSLSWLNESPATSMSDSGPKGKTTHGYATGGWTGSGSKYQPAGIVHADEYVIKKESTNRLRRKYGLSALNYINATGELPGMGGYASGGLVGNLIRFGHLLQDKGFHVTENPAFGGVNGGHSRTGWHYRGGAIDVNWPNGQRQSAEETAKINAIVGLARQYGLRTLWQWKGHYDHAHFDIDKGPDLGNFAGARGGRSGADVPWWIDKPFEFIKDAVGGLMDKIPGKGKFVDMLKGMPIKLLDFAKQKIADLVGGTDMDDTGDGGGFTSGIAQWRDEVISALHRVGQPTSLADTVLRRMQQESGGNPRAINLWDSNARLGTPSKGLMQVIDPTFATWRDRGLSNNIYDPMANIVASMRYAMNRYGSLSNAYNRSGGYAEGGLVTEGGSGLQDNGTMMYDNGGYLPPGITTVMNLTGRPEPVFTADQWDGMGSGGGKGSLIENLTIPLHGSDVTAGDVVHEILYQVERVSHGGKYAGWSN